MKFGAEKLEWWGYPTVKKMWRHVYSFWPWSTNVTDGQTQTDTQTPHDVRHSPHLCIVIIREDTTKVTRRWHVTISCQPDGRPPQPVRPWNNGRVRLAEGSNVVVFRTRNTFCRTRGVCPMQLFHFLITSWKIWWFYTEIWRYIDFQNSGRPPSWNCFTTIREHPRSPCQISCQSDTQIWRYSCLNFSHIWLKMPIQLPRIGVLGDFGLLTVIIHHRDPQLSVFISRR